MTVKFLLMVNKQGQTRLAKYFDDFLAVDERRVLEGEIVRKCLARSDKQASQIRARAKPGVQEKSDIPLVGLRIQSEQDWITSDFAFGTAVRKPGCSGGRNALACFPGAVPSSRTSIACKGITPRCDMLPYPALSTGKNVR